MTITPEQTSEQTAERTSESAKAITDNIRGTRDALSVRRVFGDPHTVDGVTVIPVAKVAGGAGGGGGEGTKDSEAGSGFGTGFGVHARPVGMYVIRNGEVEWKPSLDVNRLARGGQLLGALATVCLTVVALRYFRRPIA